MAAGTLALAVGAFFTTNANNKKYAAATSAYYLNTSGNIYTLYKGITVGAGTLNLTTVKGASSKTVFIRTAASGTIVKQFAVRSGSTLSKTIFTK